MHRPLEVSPQRRTVEWCYQLASRRDRLTGSLAHDDELIQATFEWVISKQDLRSHGIDRARIERIAVNNGVAPADYRKMTDVVQALYPDGIRDAAHFSQLLRDPAMAVQAAHQNPEWVEYFHGTDYAPMVARWYADHGDPLRAASLMEGHDSASTDRQRSYRPEPQLGEGGSDTVEAFGESLVDGLDEYHDPSTQDTSGDGEPYNHGFRDKHEAGARTDASLVGIATAYPALNPLDGGDDVGGDTEFGGDGYDDYT